MNRIQTSVTNNTSLLYIGRFFLRGLTGILHNPDISFKQKVHLLFDYIRLTITVLFNVPNLKQYHKTSGTFFITAFHLTITYQNIFAFYYMFIETFCIMIYPPKKNIDTFFDVGANNGIVSLWYRYWNPDVKIYAFEPDPEQFTLLKKNIRLNHIRNAKLYRVALGKKSGIQQFHVTQDAVYSLNSGLTKNQNLPCKTMTVRVKRLSSFIKTMKQRISLISMDIEGAEYDVFEDLLKTKTIDAIDTILFEGHHFTDEQNLQHISLSKKLLSLGTFMSTYITQHTTLNTFLSHKEK